MNTLFASFEPTEEVSDLLSSLRQAGLAWIAEEVELTLRNGHSVIRQDPHSHKDEHGHEVMPYDAHEQLRMTLRAIQRYTTEIRKIWHWTQDDLRETLAIQNLQISLMYLGSLSPLPLFNQDIEQHFSRLDALLRKAWPDGENMYDVME